MATIVVSREANIMRAELMELKSEVQEACLNKATFKAREQLLRFENILRHYYKVYDLDDRYSASLFDLKRKLYNFYELNGIQKVILEELKSLALEIKYLSKM